MALTDATYYSTPDCNLPQGTYNTLSDHITRYERDILIHILGYQLATEVLAYDSGTSSQRIKDIVEGKEYTEGDYTVKWNGLLNTAKVSLLSYYCFIEYVKNYQLSFQNIGAAVPGGENAAVVSAGQLIAKAGARCRELVGYPGNDLYAPTLYNFMLNDDNESADTYPEWIFNEYVPPNAFDI